MKQLHILLAVALFFTALGFLLGQQQAQHIPEAQPTENNQPVKAALVVNKTEIKNSVTQNPSIVSLPVTEKEKEECIPLQQKQNKGFISEADLKKIANLLASLPTNELRLKAFNDMFETNPRSPELDADSAITLNDFFRNDKSLESFIPQQVACHSNLCKVDLPAIDKSDINGLMENLSKQLGDKKLNASHILLAEDTSQGSTQLYVSLLPTEMQNMPEQNQ